MRTFRATFIAETRGYWRIPEALIFGLVVPLVIMLVLTLFNIHVTDPSGHSHSYVDLLLPGMIAFTAINMGMQAVVFGVARYKERGLLRRIKATPASALGFINGLSASRMLGVVLGAIVTYLAGRYLFGAHLAGSALGVLALTALSGPAFIALGLLVVSFTKSEDQAAPAMFLIVIPMLLFSGMFVSRAGLNGGVAWVTHGLPMTYLVDALQRVGFAGQGFSSALWTDIAGMAVWGLIATLITARAWRWES
jgi:ABC-type multidrug transport system permease subunit